MKVTVCFGSVKIVVPCRDGQLTVQDLIDKSVTRYKKATGKSESYWIHVRSLASQGEGGILDSDDLVSDVADDREKSVDIMEVDELYNLIHTLKAELTAIYEEQDGPNSVSKYIGDGTSTCNSSVGTCSPNMLETNHINNSNNKYTNHSYHNGDGDEDDSDEVVVVTGQEINSETRLHVRRGSDPIMPHVKENGTVIDTNANTYPAQQKQSPFVRNGKLRSSREELDVPFERNSTLRSSRDELSGSAFQRFGHDSSRRSLASNNAFKWAEAQQKVENKMESSEIEIPNDGTPLGIHIIARVENDDGSAYGLVVHGIEDGGRAARDGRLKPGDHIKTINGFDITQETFDRAQEIMRDAMRTPTVKVEIERERIPPLIPPESPQSPHSSYYLENGQIPNKGPTPPPRTLVPPVPARSPTTVLSSSTNGPVSPGGLTTPEKTSSLIAPTNTRRIGRKLYIQLMKGPQGLGFSITTRDNPTGGKNPIYIKNILPKGAAIADGRLKQGDRLLEVNGIEMTGKIQSEAVSILRSVKLGGVVNLIVSRQESPVKEMPRQLKTYNPIDDPTTAKNKQILTFNIGLNDTGSAGLGVSVKGKTSGGADGETKDLGIFIKSVIHGGAASKDGRLRPNDQLLCINDTSLLNTSNSDAMETLRRAMSGEKSPCSAIQLVIARRFEDQPEMPTTPRARKNLSSPFSDQSVEGTMYEHDMEWDRSSIKTPDVEAQLEKADELLKHPMLNSYNSNYYYSVDGRDVQQNTFPGRTEGKHPVAHGDEERMKSPTLPAGGAAEIVMIEDTDIDQDPTSVPSPRAPSPPNWLLNEWEKAQDGELSPLPKPDEFSRDNRARLSFSERRQGGSLDAKQMAWYKKTKEKREEKTLEKDGRRSPVMSKDVAASTGSLVKSLSTENITKNTNLSSIQDLTEDERKEIGPALGLKKSSSLESLQAAVAEVTTTEEFPGRSRAKVVRGRGCNESFRAAVDRSYDTPMNGDAPISSIEPGHSSNNHIPNGLPSNIASDHSSISSMEPGMNRTNSKRKNKDKKKSASVFKGLGSMFRFGKNRKGNEAVSPTEEDIRSHEVITTDRLKHEDTDNSREDQQSFRGHHEEQPSRKPEENNRESLSKAERMQQLREQHQQRHRERQGRYVDDVDDDPDAHEFDRVSPRMPRENRGSPHSHNSLPDSRGHHEGNARRDPCHEQDYRRNREYGMPEKPTSNGYRNDRDRREYERTLEPVYDTHLKQKKDSIDNDNGGFSDDNGYGRYDGRKDKKFERHDELQHHERDGKYRRDRSYDAKPRENKYDDKLYEERYRQGNHGDRNHDKHRGDSRYHPDYSHDRDDRIYEKFNGRSDERREDRRQSRRGDRSRDDRPRDENRPQHDGRRKDVSRDRLEQHNERHEDHSRDTIDKCEKEKSDKEQLKGKESEKSQKDKDEEKQLKRRESERSIKSKLNRRASDRNNKSKNKDKGTKLEEPAPDKTDKTPVKNNDRHSLRRSGKKDKKEERKDEPETKDKTDPRREDDPRRKELRDEKREERRDERQDERRDERRDDRRDNRRGDRRDERRDDRRDERREERQDERKDERHGNRRREDPRMDRSDHRYRPEDGRYDSRDLRYNGRERPRGPPLPPDRYGYQSLDRSHRHPRQEPSSKYYNTAPRESSNSSDQERPPPHPARVGGGGNSQYGNHYPHGQSTRSNANGPSTSHKQRSHDKMRGTNSYEEDSYYGNSLYGSLRKPRHDDREYYDREYTHYEATARV